MSVLITKGRSSTFTLSKDQLAIVPKVASDTFFSDHTNWERVSLHFKNLQGQEEVLVFNLTEAIPKANFTISLRARSDYSLKLILIKDFDDGFLGLTRSDLSEAFLNALDVEIRSATPTNSFLSWAMLGDAYTASTSDGLILTNTPIGPDGIVYSPIIPNDRNFQLDFTIGQMAGFTFMGFSNTLKDSYSGFFKDDSGLYLIINNVHEPMTLTPLTGVNVLSIRRIDLGIQFFFNGVKIHESPGLNFPLEILPCFRAISGAIFTQVDVL